MGIMDKCLRFSGWWNCEQISVSCADLKGKSVEYLKLFIHDLHVHRLVCIVLETMDFRVLVRGINP